MINSAFFKAFKYAVRGISYFIRHERNAKFHLVSTILVVLAAVYFKLNTVEWLFITSAITGVWITEMLNTAIEKACDLISKEKHPAIAVIKDVAAGAVLISSLYALIVGILIFIPEFLQLIRS